MTSQPLTGSRPITGPSPRSRGDVLSAWRRWRAGQCRRIHQREQVRHDRRDRSDRYLDGAGSAEFVTATLIAARQR